MPHNSCNQEKIQFAGGPLKITIGILAWNEEKTIQDTLKSLFAQRLFALALDTQNHIEVVCVPNGTSDDTADRAQAFFDRNSAGDRVVCSVRAVPQAGKANAWNLLVHQFSDPASDFYFFLDADITIDHPCTLSNMLQALLNHPRAQVATDLPQKHIQFKERKSLFDYVQEFLGKLTQASPAQLSGQLYCIRGPMARRIWMPTGLMIEDGFLKDMVVTNLFQSAADDSTIVRADEASHIFTSYWRARDLFRHQIRQAVGQTMNYVVEKWLRKQLPRAGIDIGEVIRERNQTDPHWVRQLMQDHGQRHWWALYPGAFLGRWRKLRNLRIGRRILYFPVALAASLFDLPVFVVANFRLRYQEDNQPLWKKD